MLFRSSKDKEPAKGSLPDPDEKATEEANAIIDDDEGDDIPF